jgi:membrane-associated phospholipid phosphatase
MTTKRSAPTARSKADEPRLPADPTSAGPLPARVGPPAKPASLLLVTGFASLVACLFVFGTIAEGIRDNEVFILDTLATPFLHGLANPVLDAVMTDASAVGSVAVKLFFHRPRPQLAWSHVPPDYSFPSGHTMNSVAFYVALAVIVWSVQGRRWGAVALAGAIALCSLIGVSRIYLGFHYFTDVFGGALAGVAWVLVTLAAFRRGPLERFWDATQRTTHAAQRAVANRGRS